MRYPIKLEDCTWKQIESALDEGYTTIVIPCATIEQHGAQLPLNTSALIAEAIALRVAQRLGNAFVAPVLRPGVSTENMDFPGTISLGDATFTDLLADTCISLSKHGFQHLVVLPSSMHPFAVSAVTDVVQTRIYEAELPGLVITYGDLLQRRRWQKDFLVEKIGCSQEEAASLAEMTMLLALHASAQRVQMPAAEPVVSERATAEIGAALLDYLAAEMAREIHERMLCRR